MYEGPFDQWKRALEPVVVEELSFSDDPVVQDIISTKALANLALLRKSAVESQLRAHEHGGSELDEYRSAFKDLECSALMAKHSSRTKLSAEHERLVESMKSKRYSVDFDLEDTSRYDEDVEIIEKTTGPENDGEESLGQLRSRLLGNRRGSSSSGADQGATTEKQMQVHNNLQEELISDMSQLVSGLKIGAEAFQNALEEDSTVLKATELGLQATSRSLTNLGGKLKKYHNSKVGLLFYLGCILFMFLSLLLTYMIVKIFPKM
ncbi:LAQU0S02e11012g1_1 [Lachancea quebecensis]|uniref:LAQU0S02e11012g1_1 n=1 Tax=Lachancea quebecensis TaxID=1654605 RepID=A0A0P1KYG2_9SACH|nr:LAQU0S02e11012g1_1 [Lachancea quebecensis]